MLLTAAIACFGESVLVHNDAYFLAVFLFLSTFLTIAMIYLPIDYSRIRIGLIGIICVLCVVTAWIDADAIPESLLFTAVISSFIAVRVYPRFGIYFYTLAFVGQAPKIVQHWALWDAWQRILIYSVTGGMFVLSFQLYEVSKKLHQFRKLSIYDELTDLHNMRYFRHKLNLLYRDPKVHSICLCLIDLDRFKAVNDAFGHREGDVVLQRVARIIEEAAAPAVVSRYGGEEFVLLLPDYTVENAVQVAERLRQAMEAVTLCLLPVTLSCGVAFASSRDKSPDQLFDEADQALYHAKQQRNCVLVFGESTEADTRAEITEDA